MSHSQAAGHSDGGHNHHCDEWQAGNISNVEWRGAFQVRGRLPHRDQECARASARLPERGARNVHKIKHGDSCGGGGTGVAVWKSPAVDDSVKQLSTTAGRN